MDFPSWYQQRHGYGPFPWQAALAERIAQGDWPEALTAPTGAGKTAVIDVWLWGVLHGLEVPRRLVYVIDRRLVVDSVTAYCTQLIATLDPEQRPAIVTMRGGMTIDEDWLSDPLRPAVILSTVDQVGSRLLFSGYGVNPRSASIHAGMLGNDALFVVDEVHLVRPLLQTLARISEMRGTAIPLPWRVLPMSATWAADNVHGLSDADWTHPVLSPRLQSSKPARLIKLPAETDLPSALAREALRLRSEGAEVVAVVCNRVARARSVFEQLRKKGEAVLLTGRIRPADKERLSAQYLPRIAVGSRGQREPLFVVATQTIEVGADLDLDALISECAPLSALRQRAGRLNRLGELQSAPMVVIYQVPKQKSDPVYGEEITQAWKWLNAVARGKPKTVDFGIQALQSMLHASPPPDEPAQDAPILLDGHVRLLAHTSVPHGIRVAPWLHGWNSSPPDVYLCWRADASLESVQAAPPIQPELLALPLYAFQKWMDDIADIEGAGPIGDDSRNHPLDCIRWDGESAQRVRSTAIRAGDTVVLASEQGGCDAFGWAPHSKDATSDLGDCEWRVRLHPRLRPEMAEAIRAVIEDEDARDTAWRHLARDTGVLDGKPGRVLPYPGGVLVLRATEWTSHSAIRKVSLAEHQKRVGERAEAFAQGSRLDERFVKAVRRAGAAHDTGKQDPRWQAMVGGDGSLLLAKGPGGDARWLTLPRGWRHEMASALHPTDPLVRHLVGSHHGLGRPIFPAAPDIDLWRKLGGWAETWAELQTIYGAWGLAYLEALVRLADWSVSAEEQA